MEKFFLPITPERRNGFEYEAARLVSKGNLDGLKTYQEEQDRTLCWDACNSRGETLLHLACRTNSRKVVKYLLKKRAPLNVRDKLGRSPLVELCWTAKPDFALIEAVLNKEPGLAFASSLYLSESRHSPVRGSIDRSKGLLLTSGSLKDGTIGTELHLTGPLTGSFSSSSLIASVLDKVDSVFLR